MNSAVRNQSYRAYFGVFLVVGLSFGLVGPSIGLLADQIGTNLASIGIVLVAYGFGYIVGTQVFARGYDLAWGNKLIGTALLVGAGCLTLIPFVSTRIVLAVVFMLLGSAISTSDVGCNTLIVWELKERVGPSLALMHTMFGVGAILSPLIVRWSDVVRGDAAIAYWLAAIAMTSIAVVVLAHKPPLDPHLESRVNQGDIPLARVLVIVMFFMAYVALEVAFVTWIYTYGTKVGLSKTAAAILTSTYWVGFMGGRLATVLIARRSPGIVAIQIGAAVNIAVCLVIFLQVEALLIPCAIVYGLAAAPQFPLMFSFIGSRSQLSGKLTSRIVGTAGLSATTLPWVAGQLLERVGISSFPIFLACCAVGVIGATRLIDRSFDTSTVAPATA